MANMYTGIQICSNSIKMAQVDKGRVVKYAVGALPENSVREGNILSPEALGGIVRALGRDNQIKNRAAAAVIPMDTCFIRHVSMPYVPIDQLLINLPYEFRDYILTDREDYIYDYSVINENKDEDGKIISLDMIIVAVRREIVERYGRMLSKAGYHMKIAVPEPLAYENIIKEHERKTDRHNNVYCIVDMGHKSVCIHLYKDSVYDTTREIELGGANIDIIISQMLDVDIHIATAYKETNFNNVQSSEECMDFYNSLVLEIGRAINFYSYNNPDITLEDIYICGGLSKIKPLVEHIKSSLEVKCHTLLELLPEQAENDDIGTMSAVIGATMQ